MALTVGDIRKALAKYSDDTIVANTFRDDFSPLTACAPLKAKGAFTVKQVSKDLLYNKAWFKADLSNKKVISIKYDPEYSNEFWAGYENASPYWKSYIDKQEKRISRLKPLSYNCSGQLYY